jgi:carbon-monoxide dehydrogenase medium subunit
MSGGTITDARVGLAAVGPNTAGIPAISELLRGKAPSEELFAQAGALAAEACNPSRDLRGTVEYKRHLASELTRRALSTSVDRINGQGA